MAAAPAGPGAVDALPAGARCAVHDAAAAELICTRCGTFACNECIFSRVPRREVCRACASEGMEEPVPWERRKEIGTIRAFFATTKLVNRTPTRFFRTPATESGPVWPVIYGISIYTFGQLVYLIELFLFIAIVGIVIGLVMKEPAVAGIAAGYSVCWGMLAIPLTLAQAPIYGVLAIVVGGGLSHLTLKLFKAANAPFEDTLRAVAYSDAPYFYYFIPIFGPLISWVWMIIVEVIALRETHRIGTDRAVVAVLAYRLLLLALFIGLYVALFAAVFALEAASRSPY
jgi:hypothetical protein